MEYQRCASCFISVVLLLVTMQCEAQLSPSFYSITCPNVLTTIRNSIRVAVSRERRMAASIIRLNFHDCFVNGCDASILLRDGATFQGEQTALVNFNSIRGLNVIEDAKAQVETTCPGIVSCADILAVAARDASTLVGGPSWVVKLGRRDSTTASLAQANIDMPRFSDPLATLISKFAAKGLSAREMVALSGSHSVGQGQCFTFRGRIYNETNIDAGFASTRRRNCPPAAPNGDTLLAPIDLVTPVQLDNNYFKNLLQRKGLFSSDQVLFNGGFTDGIVTEYSQSPSIFAADFASAMLRMGEIQPLTGQNGIIRRTCSNPN